MRSPCTPTPRRTLTTLLLLILGLSLAGCSGSDNPAAPADGGGNNGGGGGGGGAILTPTSLRITKISVSNFGDKNGGVWDLSTNVSNRRADLYVTLGTGTSTNAPIYVSDVVENAFPGAPYDFISSAAGVGLPKTFGAQRRAYITLWDEDGLSADDEIGNFSFDPLDHYENDNRAGFYEVFFGTNSTKVSVTGTWIY